MLAAFQVYEGIQRLIAETRPGGNEGKKGEEMKRESTITVEPAERYRCCFVCGGGEEVKEITFRNTLGNGNCVALCKDCRKTLMDNISD